ncbi:hypothetical protein BFW38_07470 [Terasakiispira papahanaumokuakeensis]|uniref:Thiamine pyrimidine synthase n=1 Tax=Terasakiispira papahanaumokuakeensis TaxID=197479 RepID=A0A1E2V918_9GAMM|nr:ABC transporter substrate-binding protein [Terasakiispira papahanaumokuakeensis]ODC03413.1 hypothetical protein BFW38_07470 [Terasakiispira papahanaumokuakeensis]
MIIKNVWRDLRLKMCPTSSPWWWRACILTGSVLLGLLAYEHRQNTHSASSNEPQTELKIATMWVANPQFSGYLQAIHNQLYRQQGLDVSLLPYQDDMDVRQQVLEGKAQFGVETGEQIMLAQSQGDPLVAIAAIFRLNPVALAVKKSKNVHHPEALKGLKIGTLPDGTTTMLKTLLAHYGMTEADVSLVPAGANMLQRFIRGELDAIPVYIFDEPWLLDQKSVPYNLLLYQDYGIDTYGDTLFTTQSMIQQHPDVVKHFVQASIEGWRQIIANPAELLPQLTPQMSPQYQNPQQNIYMLRQAIPLIYTGVGPMGWMERRRWQDIYEILQSQHIIEHSIDPRNGFTNRFLISTTP